ncbi:hypothetical protein FOYG_08462 [Fusarium oxysporum NRRL 32931]|uniref:Uncharacterized protein n=1 Tax=Fusarium oxysporum NRRL 32931 TaxID=660029 RepID=W9I8U9_FUSOX|nr:hypothetical protein FOYG_08462 [Fusarium oxysporum NRRL 32931]
MHMQLAPQDDERLDLITNHLLGLDAVLGTGSAILRQHYARRLMDKQSSILVDSLRIWIIQGSFARKLLAQWNALTLAKSTPA